MKGTLGLCLFLCISCTFLYSVNGVPNVKTDKRPTKKVVKQGDTTGPEIMKCEIDPAATNAFTKFEWKVGTKSICEAATKTADCAIKDPYKNVYQIGTTKYNLKAKDTVAVPFTLAGEYACAVTATPAETIPAAQLTVAATPKCPNHNVKVQKGDTHKITCTQQYQGTVKPTLKLTLGGTDVTGPTSKEDKVGEITTNTLTFTVPATVTATEGDKAYTCVASSADDKTYTDECSSTVTVVAKVIATKPVDTAARIDAKDVKMHCTVADKATGYTSVTWTSVAGLSCVGKETGDPPACTGTPAANHNLDAKKHDLNIKKVTKDSADKYTCTVATPSVTYSANLIPITAESPVCSKADKKVTCKVTYKGTVPPTVEWYKGATKVVTTPAVANNVVTVDATVDDEKAEYKCKVVNGAMAYECLGSGAPALDARIYQSTLLSLVVVWLWYQFK